MDYIIANVDNAYMKIETELNEQIGWNELPFIGMDKSTSAVCNFFNLGKCEKEFCPFRHIKAEQKTIVCKHWLRALCKKGDSCEFLHEYDMSKMPECYFFR
jgi:cleavage and polyadenylation specificity factor subunit 4